MRRCAEIIGAIILVLGFMVMLLLAMDTIIDKMGRIEHAIDASISGVHERLDQLDSIEDKIYSYEDAMEAIALVLERNTGYMLYQELGIVVMSHDEYLRRGGN